MHALLYDDGFSLPFPFERFSYFGSARKGAPSRFAPSKVRHSSRDVELTDLFVNCASNAHDLGPFAVLFSITSAAPRIYSSTADKLLPGSRFDLCHVFATSPVVVFCNGCVKRPIVG